MKINQRFKYIFDLLLKILRQKLCKGQAKSLEEDLRINHNSDN